MIKREKYTIILFYKFFTVKNPQKLKEQQKKLAETFHLKGRMLIAKEGINATFEGLTKDIKAYQKKLTQNTLFKGIVFKDSSGNGKGFTKLKVKVRSEIVTLEAGEFNVKKETAPQITARQFDNLYEKEEDFVVLDLRNDFEVKAGYFEKTVNPELKNFRDLPQKIRELSHLKNKKVVAVCTGGIRCEKATCLLKKEGFTNLYQLEDGIWSYMKKYPGKRFKGTLFTFDNRMTTSVVDDIEREIIAQCAYCKAKCETFYNDDSTRPSRKVICCDKCIAKRKHILRPAVSV